MQKHNDNNDITYTHTLLATGRNILCLSVNCKDYQVDTSSYILWNAKHFCLEVEENRLVWFGHADFHILINLALPTPDTDTSIQ